MSDSVQPHRWQPTRLRHPWDSPGKNTGEGYHFLLQCMKMKSESEVAQLSPTLSDPMDYSPPGSSVHGIFQARVLEWVAISFSSNEGDLGSIPGSGIFPGEGNGNQLEYFCLENSMDRGAWWAVVHGVAKSRTWLSDFTLTFHFHALEKEMATNSSVLACRIPETGEPGGLQPMESHSRTQLKRLSSSSSRSFVVLIFCIQNYDI